MEEYSVSVDCPFISTLLPGERDPDQRDVVTLSVPDIGAPVAFTEILERSLHPGSITWTGRNAERPHEQLMVTTYGGAVVGTLRAHGATFLVQGHVDGDWTLRQVTAEDHGCAYEDGSGEEPATSDTGGTRDTGIPATTGGFELSSYPLEVGDDPTDWGPYQGYDAVVDVYFVYGPPARDLMGSDAAVVAATVQGIADMNQALSNSDVNSVVRLVGVEDIDWQSSGGTTDALQELVNNTNGAEELSTRRDELGADLVVGLFDPDPGQLPGKAQPRVALGDPSASSDGTFIAVIAPGNCVSTLSCAHELGHLLGLAHDFGTGEPSNMTVSYAFGFHWPDENQVDDPNDICGRGPGSLGPDGEPMQTIMSKTNSVEVDGVDFNTGTRIPWFSNPDVMAPRDCIFGDPPIDVPTGTDTPNGQSRTADAARRLDESFPIVADYRPAAANTFGTGATITSPSSGAAVSGTETFTWGSASPGDEYALEIYDPSDGTSIAYVTVTGATTTTVPGLPTDGRVIAARLWTNVSVATDPQWTWVDHRYNNASQFVDCTDDQGATGLDPTLNSEHVNGTCSDTIGAVCSYASGTITCDLDRGANIDNIDNAELFGASAFYSTGEAYDLLLYGHGDNDQPFCCLVNDPNEVVSQLRVNGSARPDAIRLYDEVGRNLTAYGTNLQAIVDGNGGADLIDGSDSTKSGYEELLRGGTGNDTIDGRGGDDVLRAGPGGAILYGGPGNDVLLAGTGFDELYGERGNDDLCTEQLGDLLIGANWFDVELDKLYVSQAASDPHNPGTVGRTGNVCGHTTHGTFAGPDCTYTMAAAPSDCAALGLPD